MAHNGVVAFGITSISCRDVGEEWLLRERLHARDCGRILDCAAGDGRFLSLLAESCATFGEIVALDPDRDALDEARRSGLPRSVRFRRAAGEALPFPSASFETAAISDGLHHVRNPSRVLSELRRVTVPGGLIIVSEVLRAPVSGAAATAIRLHHFKARLDSRRGVRHQRTFSEPELLRVVAGACPGDAVEALRVERGDPQAAQAEQAEQSRSTHAARLRDYMRALRGDARYPQLRAVAETLAARVTETGFTPPPRMLIFIRVATKTETEPR